MKFLFLALVCLFSNLSLASEEKVLGSMDPDIIRRIMLDHLPNFRYCYQKELDKGFEGKGFILLDFTIGDEGTVVRADVSSQAYYPDVIKDCILGNLRSIRFPSPMGGGTVEVKQPINFYSSKS